VCAGGHFSGGGYGLLVRQRGLTVDWISSVDILTVDTHGNVVPRTVDRTHDPELFRACRGAGGGNFGVVTSFTFDRLPSSPREVALVKLRFPWKDIDADALYGILSAFGHWLHTRGRNSETNGLAAVLTLGGKRANNSLNIDVQFTDERGEANDLSIVREFLQQFPAWTSVADTERQITRRAWLEATINGSDFGGAARAKFKSTYMKEPFTRHETDTLYRFLASPDIDNHGFVLEIDAYGGAANNSARIADTAVAQRASIMKLQWQCYWQDPKDDVARLKFMDDFYTAMYTGPHVQPQFQGTPMGERYEGCYINYPDADMLRYSFWPELYYGSGGLYAHLQDVKRRYDPNNIFHSSMSIRPPRS
jgi:FAD/FMN-containing dehydrogenase